MLNLQVLALTLVTLLCPVVPGDGSDYMDPLALLGIEKPVDRNFLVGTWKCTKHFSKWGKQVEDAYVFMEDRRFHMILRDVGVIRNGVGLYLDSGDGIHWSEPMLGYDMPKAHLDASLIKHPGERFERPQVLMRNGHPIYLFVSFGDRNHVSSGAVLRVKPGGSVVDGKRE